MGKINISNTSLTNMIGNIYEAAFEGNWQLPLSLIAESVCGNKAFFSLIDIVNQKPLMLEFSATKQLPTQPMLDYQSRPFEDPFHVAISSMVAGEALDLNAIVDINQHIESEYYKSIFEPLEVHYSIGGILIRDGQRDSVFAVHRSKDEIPFSKEDINLIRLIFPHFSKALRIHADLEMYKKYSNIAESLLAQTNKAILLCDKDCKVVKANDYALQSLKTSKSLSIVSNHLTIDQPIYQALLEQHIQDCISRSYLNIGSHQTLLVEVENQNEALISVAPLRLHDENEELTTEHCIVTIAFQAEIAWQALRKDCNLTPSESKLIKGIVKAKTLRELAQELDIAYETVRTHLKNIFTKAEVSSQTELMFKLNLYRS